MAQGDRKPSAVKRDGQMTKISLVTLLVVLLLILEIYAIINDPKNFIVLGGLGVFILVAVYAETVLIHKMITRNIEDQEEAYQNVYRSEKASYLLMRKYFDQMEHKMDEIGKKSGIPYKELVTAQKALAKVQITRSKENAVALMNSNDRMLQQILNFQKTLENNTSDLTELQKSAYEEGNKDILQKQQEILAGLRELEVSLKQQILESTSKMASVNSQTTVQQTMTDVSAESDLDKMLKNLEPEPLPEPEFELELEPESEMKPVSEPEKIEKPGHDMTPDEIAALVATSDLGDTPEFDIRAGSNFNSSVAAELDDIVIPDLEELLEPKEEIKETEPEPEFDSLPDLEIEFEHQPEIHKDMEQAADEPEPELDDFDFSDLELEEPAEQENLEKAAGESEKSETSASGQTDLSDSGNVMNADEIAALIANTDNLIEPEPAQNSKPPMPDLSDPGHVMSADEIAALLANM